MSRRNLTHNLNVWMMARITKFVNGVQNHWKKSLFGAAAIAYGINYANEKYK